MVHLKTQKSVTTRLKRIEGQVRGIMRMVEEERECVDVLTQISAVRAALHKTEKEILEAHVSCCVSDAFKRGSKAEQQEKIDELVQVLSAMTK